MRCGQFRQNLSLSMKNELDPALRERFENHARTCENCRRLVAENRRLASLFDQAARADEAWVEPELEGLERLVIKRARRRLWENGPAAGLRSEPSRAAWRISLAFNFCSILALVLLILHTAGIIPGVVPNMGRRGPSEPLVADAGVQGIPSNASLTTLYGEFESLYGARLNWLAENRGEVAMDIIHDPAHAGPPNADAGPVVALVYWLKADDNKSDAGISAPTIILARPGREIHYVVPHDHGGIPLEIGVNSLVERQGKFTIATKVKMLGDPQPGSALPATPSAVAAELTVPRGKSLKLGQLRINDRFYDAFLEIQILTGKDHDA